ncbi:hypothetical protein CBR_g12176 [Chara braunii]|uniref:Uncharacterized protein n=1 Tax=Chara braunii TaxID=69332 RepID=A0A388KRP0_CHABU|nr:hypothetical protein CBR_g12176 [Chara braunii]|eukprot:GBG72603.1 hypothetical protein CBR_g12176 [Chara braunii]
MRGAIQDGSVGPSGRGGPSLAELRARVNEAHATVKELTAMVRDTRARLSADNLKRCARQRDVRALDIVEDDVCRARVLKGHTRKVYAIDWCQSDPNKLVSASQDGWLVVWNAFTGNKLFSIKQYNPWVMTCAYAPAGNLVARGGLDNLCAIYSLSQSRMDREGNLPPVRMLQGHKGYVACCKFVEDSQILSASGDKTCILWDVPGNRRLHTFGGDGGSGTGHTADVMSISVSPSNSHIFVSGSCDNTAKLWDMRTPGTAQALQHFGIVEGLVMVRSSKQGGHVTMKEVGGDHQYILWGRVQVCSSGVMGHQFS